MSLVIRDIAVDGFRKFRKPFTLEGLSDGLNIVIEPNEVGKSTLLEALRAAFFVRYNTRNQLAQSFAPYGEAIGPEVKVGFDVDGVPWTIAKRFLRSQSIEVTGPQGRAQGEEAEARLNMLLGSVRDTSRNGDISTYGALGLLWVAQTEALEVSAPGHIVRETITSTLEAEVGSIMGSEAYRRVRQRVETQYDLYWTPTGQKKGRQNDARGRAEAAETLVLEADTRLEALERSFAELEASQGRLKSVQREIADDTDAQTRRDLVLSLDVARAAAQILSTRKAEQEVAAARLTSLTDLKDRHEAAAKAREIASTALDDARQQRTGLAEALAAAKDRAATARSGLDDARAARQNARAKLTEGEEQVRQHRRRTAIASALLRHEELLVLEAQRDEAKALAATAIPATSILALEEHDRAVAAGQAILSAGATHIALSGQTDGVTLDGEPMVAGKQTLTRVAHIQFGATELVVTPPAAAASAEEGLASALLKRKALLNELGVDDLAAARTRNEAVRDATAELRTLDARIASVTPADEILALAAGVEALKLLVGELGGTIEPGDDAQPDIGVLTEALDAADTELARAEGAQDSAIAALRRAEEDDIPAAAIEAGAASDLANAASMIEAIEQRPEWHTLDAELTKALEGAAEAAVKLEEANRDATAHDVATITRKIEVIDARARTSAEAKARLETEIARLEGTIESEGGLGLADRAAAAREEAEAARAALQRITEEAQTLKMLRDTLESARNETSAKFVGPVAKRAKRYVERLLPDSELIFSEDLALESVVRAGVEEQCGSLSRGTQEQLSVLTRIAFADMLLDQGKPVSLILDDPLVYSDDGRLDTMIDILSEAATRMQVILLTCRDRAFRHVSGNRITVTAP